MPLDDFDSDVFDLAHADTCLYCCLPVAECECLTTIPVELQLELMAPVVDE